jgi:hypothetical protein
MDRYASALRDGSATPYECLRFIGHSFWYEGGDVTELVRRAALVLVRHDPFLVATAVIPGELELSEEEIGTCVAAWPIADEELKAFLEAHVIVTAIRRYDPDRRLAARLLAALERAAPRFAEDLGFRELYADALQWLGDERYAGAVDALIAATEPEGRAHPLREAMERAVAQTDWRRYDALRDRWTALPKNARVCECAVNFVANVDGLRALDRGDEQSAIGFLRAAVAIHGCPHLNSGAITVRLAQELLARGIALDEVKEHVRAAEEFHVTEETTELRSKLEGLRG